MEWVSDEHGAKWLHCNGRPTYIMYQEIQTKCCRWRLNYDIGNRTRNNMAGMIRRDTEEEVRQWGEWLASINLSDSPIDNKAEGK